MAEIIMAFSVFLLVAAVMLGIGINQYKSKTPVAFYSGEKPPKESELTDVEAWNKKHGLMWIIYGIIIIVSSAIGCLIIESVWSTVFFCGGTIVPVVFMIWYHGKLIKEYRKGGGK